MIPLVGWEEGSSRFLITSSIALWLEGEVRGKERVPSTDLFVKVLRFPRMLLSLLVWISGLSDPFWNPSQLFLYCAPLRPLGSWWTLCTKVSHTFIATRHQGMACICSKGLCALGAFWCRALQRRPGEHFIHRLRLGKGFLFPSGGCFSILLMTRQHKHSKNNKS